MPDKLLATARKVARFAPEGLDLANEAHLRSAEELADALLDCAADPGELAELEEGLMADPTTPLQIHLAAKLALSRGLLAALPGPLHLSVVFAVYHENKRILPPDQVAGGEDFLRRKAAQLDWLASGRPDLTWDMLVVDDGCPHDSGGLAERIAEENELDDRVRVLRLAEAIALGLPVTRPLTDTTGSMKGGAIALGMWTAAETPRPNHVVLFTDADLSTHLGQAGLLMDGVLGRGFDAAIGSRREPRSVVIKHGVRNTRGKLFIYLWKRIIGVLPDIVDTQCGFKAFGADTVRAIVPDLQEKKFAFDIELLIKARLRREDAVTRVPIAWIDSEALSTTTDLQPYLPMLQAMVKMYRTYLPETEEAEVFATFIDELDDETWAMLVENIPEDLVDRNPAEFGEWAEVPVETLRRAAGL